MSLFPKKIQVGARDSLLSKAQVEEVLQAIQEHHPEIEFETFFLKTKGDKDQLSSLLHMGKSDFFTKELDDLLLNEQCRITIHSAKDLPEPLPKGLSLIACTKGQDPSDVLVLKKGEKTLANSAKVGTSSLRRIENVRKVHKQAICVDIRGTIEKRLMLLEEGKVDALVLPTAALLRLKLHANTMPLPGEPCPLQGRLAILAREGDLEMKELFSPLDGQ
jgi:hydroxymethylbilane synthase